MTDQLELKVSGLRELQRALTAADKATRRQVRTALRRSGDLVRGEGERLFSPFSLKSAEGFRVRVRQRGIAVEQSLRKTTGKHPEWGALQMTKALVPALDRKREETERLFEEALDEVERIFNTTGAP